MSKQLEDIINEYKVLGIQQQLDYDRFYLYSIITHSTAIEGSTVTEIENQLLFDEGISANKPIKEQLMNLDLKKAYEQSFFYAENHTDISVELLCNLASLVMKNTGSTYKTIAGEFSSSNGELRLLNVSAGRGGKSYLAWQKVNDRLTQFCKWLNEERKNIDKNDISKVYELSFEAHYRIVSIHPWADGNGRMSRLLMNMIQYEMGVIPAIIKKEKRSEYISSLSKSQDEDNSTAFIDFMINNHCDNLLEQIKEYKTSTEIEPAKTVVINGKSRELKGSYEEAFTEAVKKLDKAIEINQELADENEKLRKQLQSKNHNNGNSYK